MIEGGEKSDREAGGRECEVDGVRVVCGEKVTILKGDGEKDLGVKGDFEGQVLESSVSINWGSENEFYDLSLGACKDVGGGKGEVEKGVREGEIVRSISGDIVGSSSDYGQEVAAASTVSGVFRPSIVGSGIVTGKALSGSATGRSLPAGKALSGSATGRPWLVSSGGYEVSGGRISNSCTTLFVNNIPPLVSYSNLKAWFLNFGSVVDVFIPKKRSKVKGFCFAFVRFRHEFEALQACEKDDGSTFEGFVLEVNVYRYPRVAFHSRAYYFLGQSANIGGLISGSRSFADSASILLGRPSAGHDGLSYFDAFVRGVSGLSYAQILKAGGFPKGVMQGSSTGGYSSGGVIVKQEPCAENFDHLQAILSNRPGRGEVPDRLNLLCVDEFLLSELVIPNTNEGCRSSSTMRANVSYPSSNGDPAVTDLLSKGEGFDGDTDHSVFAITMADCCVSSEVNGDDSTTQSRILTADFEDDDSCYFLKVAGPMSKDEKAEFSDHVRLIDHDALQMGKKWVQIFHHGTSV